MTSKKSEKKPLWKPTELRKEEVRGIFAIGVITILISLKILGESSVLFGFDVYTLLMAFWMAYILLMCIGLSDDLGEILFQPGRGRNAFIQLTKLCKVYAKMVFGLGIFTILLAVLIVLAVLLTSWLILLTFGVILFIVCISRYVEKYRSRR